MDIYIIFINSCPEETAGDRCQVSCADYECKNNGTCFIANGTQNCQYVSSFVNRYIKPLAGSPEVKRRSGVLIHAFL